MEEIKPDAARLKAAREEVETFMERKSAWSKALFILTASCEVGFFVLMLLFMDFGDHLHRFIFFTAMFIYCPLIMLVYRNSVRIDQLFYRLVEELKYKE